MIANRWSIRERATLWAIIPVLLAAGAVYSLWTTPRDLKLESVEVARAADIPDLKDSPASKRGDLVALIGFSTAKDFRGTAHQEPLTSYSYIVDVRTCGCDDTGEHNAADFCNIAIGLFDRAGLFIGFHPEPHDVSSRTRPDETRTVYHTYVALLSDEMRRSRYDFTRQPKDLCLRIEGHDYIAAPQRSNTLVISKEMLASAVSRAHLQ